MRYVAFITVALLTFAVGIALSSLVSTTTASPEIQPVADLVNDDLHRLFEAAHMSKDEKLRDDVLGRFQCMGEDRSLRRRVIHLIDFEACGKFDDETLITDWSSPNSTTAYDVIKTHGEWSRKNMPFIQSISDPVAAQAYIKQRLKSE